MQHLKELTAQAREALDKLDQGLDDYENIRVKYFL